MCLWNKEIYEQYQSLLLIALGLSAPAFANSTVLVPSQHGGFKVGVDALYLQPTNSDLIYATNRNSFNNGTFPLNPPGDNTFDRNLSVDPGYDWGFYAQVGYLFPCTGNDLTVGYTYLHSHGTASAVAPGADGLGFSGSPAIIVSPLSQLITTFLGDAILFATAQSKAKFDLDAVDLEGGQRFTTGAYDMRMFAGLRYAKIDHSLQTFAQVPLGAPLGFRVNALDDSQIFQSQFKGIGPRIGVDGRYCLNGGFGIDANLSTVLLIGRVDSNYSAQNNFIDDDGVVTTTNFAVANGSETRVVPVLEAKLGVDYTYILNCRSKSSLTFEAGYQASNYFNAVDHVAVLTTVTDPPSVASQNTNSDVGFDGIYVGIKYYA